MVNFLQLLIFQKKKLQRIQWLIQSFRSTILQEMKKRSGEQFVLKDGSMYPILYRMIDKGLITDEQVLVGRRRTRVYYHLTEEGKASLEEIKAEYLFITEGITKLLNYQEEQK